MSTIKNPTRFSELEYCLQGYFDCKLAPANKHNNSFFICLFV